LAQTLAELPAFDVASLKPSVDPGVGQNIHIRLGNVRHGLVTLENNSMSDLLQFTFGLASAEQISGPDWIGNYKYRYDLEAKTAPETSTEQVLLMMQRLVAERFHLAVHHEPRAIAHLELGVAKGGPKLHTAKGTVSAAVTYGPGKLEYTRIPMRILAVLLSRQLKQPVVDKTGIDGYFDIDLEWLPDEPVRGGRGVDGAPMETDMAQRPDLFRAVQIQLGLKLDQSKMPMDVLVIDHVDQTPVGN
jgi:uncharacterized protein (TIGR03435 family)